MSTRIIIAVDPGKTTGISILQIKVGEEPVLLDSNELVITDFAPYMRNQFERFWIGPHEPSINMEIVCERFTINAQTVRNSQAPWSLEQIGVMKQICRDYNYSEEKIIWQQPADAMNMFNNEKLKRLGYWHRGGKDHANDSIRHALLRAVKVGWVPKGLLG
jgi:hypothetical protein